MRKIFTPLSLTAIALLANALTPAISDAATVKKLTPATFTFALWGDMPYAKNGDNTAAIGSTDTPLTRLISSINSAKVSFSIFDGDTKDGSSFCTDKTLAEDAKKIFSSLAIPTVYVPGDNEWTDCHRINNDNYNSLERLDFLRKNMFNTNMSFGAKPFTLTRQGSPSAIYSENSRWTKGNVVFMTLNIPGSNNNKVNPADCISTKSKRTQTDCDADNAEYLARDKANIDFMKESFQTAKDGTAAGVMIVIQGDPVFDFPETETVDERTTASSTLAAHDGYDNFLAALFAETKAFAGQVVLVHGDSHFYKVDKPMMLQSIKREDMVKNFTRVETFGSPSNHWIKVTVTPSNANVFTFEPVIVKGN
jgi:hypothetical protein